MQESKSSPQILGRGIFWFNGKAKKDNQVISIAHVQAQKLITNNYFMYNKHGRK